MGPRHYDQRGPADCSVNSAAEKDVSLPTDNTAGKRFFRKFYTRPVFDYLRIKGI